MSDDSRTCDCGVYFSGVVRTSAPIHQPGMIASVSRDNHVIIGWDTDPTREHAVDLECYCGRILQNEAVAAAHCQNANMLDEIRGLKRVIAAILLQSGGRFELNVRTFLEIGDLWSIISYEQLGELKLILELDARPASPASSPPSSSSG